MREHSPAEAADVAATTEYVALRGDSLVALAEVLRVGGLNLRSRGLRSSRR